MVSRDAETVFCRVSIGLAFGCAGEEIITGSATAIIVHLLSDTGPENDSGLCSVDEGGWGPGLLGTVHSWIRIWPNYTNISNPNNLSSVALDRSQKHTFGGSYDPVHQRVSWWVDGVRQMTADSPYVPAIAVRQHFYLILSAQTHGQNKPYSMFISGVRAYVPRSLTLLTPMVQSNSFTFNWIAMSGQIYQVQYSTNMSATNWTNFGNPITATNSRVTISGAMTNAQQFYRVVLLL